MNIKFLAFGIICLVLGFFVGRSIGEKTSTSTGFTSNLQSLQDLADNEIADYYRLKTLEEKYKKADEILGKMVAIFLADLGVRVSSDVAAASKIPAPPLSSRTESTPAATEATPSPPSNSISPAQLSNALSATPAQADSPKIANRTPLEAIRSDSEIAEFLKLSQIKDFDSALKTSAGYKNSNSTLPYLLGRFVGSATATRRDKLETWETEMVLDARMARDGRLFGSYSLKLAKGGRVFSNKSGKGGLDSEWREWKDDPEVIFVEVSPNMFLQMYYLKSSDSLIGNVVEQDKRDRTYKTIGTIRMNRA